MKLTLIKQTGTWVTVFLTKELLKRQSLVSIKEDDTKSICPLVPLSRYKDYPVNIYKMGNLYSKDEVQYRLTEILQEINKQHFLHQSNHKNFKLYSN